MNQTSRHWLLDWVEFIWQQCALVSHLQEIIDSYWENEDISIIDKENAEYLIEQSNISRRNIMEKILLQFEWNKLYWCSVKHSIFAYELACELLYANKWDWIIEEIQRSAKNTMYSILSKFLWKPVVLCWRCLNDMIEDELQENILH